MLSLLDSVIIVAAGVAAGIINVVAGAGTLITFPVLLALGVPPVTANLSNTVGLIPASVSGAWGYRRELRGQWRSVLWMASLSGVGGLAGGGALLLLPPENFTVVVPYLLLLAAVLSAVQPRVAAWVRRRSADEGVGATRPLTFGLIVGVLLTGVYGGYFGAAQGVVLLALLGILWSTDLNRANGAKNVLAGVANVISAALFVVTGMVDWQIALLIGIGSATGGLIGSRIGRKLSAPLLRAVLVIVAFVAAIVLFVS